MSILGAPKPNNDRGFTNYTGGSITTSYGHPVDVYESSAAVGPHVWLSVGDSPELPPPTTPYRAAHLTLPQAVAIREALGRFIENVRTGWEDGEQMVQAATVEALGEAAATNAHPHCIHGPHEDCLQDLREPVPVRPRPRGKDVTDTDLNAPIITFLRTCLDQDEQAAQGLSMATVMAGKTPDFYGCGGPAAHNYWDHFPAHRALIEVDVKRRIISHHYDDDQCTRCVDDGEDFYACETLKLLTLPYADRPGYDKTWE